MIIVFTRTKTCVTQTTHNIQTTKKEKKYKQAHRKEGKGYATARMIVYGNVAAIKMTFKLFLS